ncbi:MAG: hypothetical protein GX877_05420 [Bacteroidales bacterium]|nr:hypothetical protein [Bacteroidales bacterium]
MNRGLIASRYANALLQYATGCKADFHLYRMMKQVDDCYWAIPDLEIAFSNRTLLKEQRKALFLDLFPEYHSDALHVLSGFLDLLIRHKRESLMHSVAMQYVEKYRNLHGILYGVLTTVVPPGEELMGKIKKALKPDQPENVELDWKSDPGLIGGVTLTLGMNEWDASIRTRLKELRASYGLKETY